MSDAQLKRKRSQREKASATTLPKRQKSDHLQADTAASTPKSNKTQTLDATPNTQAATPTALSQESAPNASQALQVASTPADKKKTRRSRKRLADHVAVEKAQVFEKPVAKVEGKPAWSLSQPLGGRLIAHDPVFSQDESCVFTSNGREVEVLSIATSLVERKLSGPDNSATALAASLTDQEELYVASSSGQVQRWDWTTGAPVNDVIKFEGSIRALAVTLSEDASRDVLYAICHNAGQWTIATESRSIYTSKEPLQNLRVQGDFVVAATSAKLVVGKRTSSDGYDFVEITIAPGLCSLDCRVESSESRKKTKSENISVAVGNVSGEIFLYENVFPSDKSADLSLTPRTLHWHREAVASVKWSRDGNYLISGGRETVLVLWQLATGKKQFLPHLTAEIERLTVSPSGASYGIQLADNSVMVLSTTELKPIANFAGLQAQSSVSAEKANSVPFDSEKSFFRPAAAALNPLSPEQLLLSVPSSSNEISQSSSAAPRPFLQTYDISNDRHISRQALTRNNVTDFNKGPEGNRLKVPDVAFLQVSHDGQWLATAEHWSPPYPDVEHLAADKPTNDEQRQFRREVYLKIWRWDQERNLWALETRIDSPHQLGDDAQPGRVLNLVADPVEVGFASVGEDSCVRIWKPKTRLRNGIVVRGTKAEGLVDWSCRHSIPLDRSVELAEIPDQPRLLPPPKGAALAYSEDGSTLAVSQAFEHAMETPTVHFINTNDGVAEQARAGYFTGNVRALAFLDRHLIVLADQTIAVWDIVDETQQYCINLDRSARSGTSLLTTNPEDQTFAVSVRSKGGVSRVQIFSPTNSTPQFNQSLHYSASAVLAVKGRRGYKVLTTAAEVHTLIPRTPAPSLAGVRTRRGKRSNNTPATIATTSQAIEAPTSAIEDAEMAEAADVLLLENDEEADKPIVRPEQLASVFDRDNVALMPVREMFDAVVGLFARKPRVLPVQTAA